MFPSLQKLSATFRRGDLLEALSGLAEKALATVRQMKDERAAWDAETLAIEQVQQELRSRLEGMRDALKRSDIRYIEEHEHLLERTEEKMVALTKRTANRKYPSYDEQLVTWVDQLFGDQPA